MTDRSGCGLVELTVLQSLEALVAGHLHAHVKSSRAVAAVEERIGLGPRPGPAGRLVVTAGPLAPARPPFAAHLVIEALPAQVGTFDVMQAITSRIESRRWHDSHPELARRARLPVADIHDDSPEYGVRILLSLKPGTDPVAARDQLLAVDAVSWHAPWAFPAPLASLLRSWAGTHQGEDLAASLTQLEEALRRDRADASRG